MKRLLNILLSCLLAGLFFGNANGQCMNDDPSSPEGITPTTFGGNNPDVCFRVDPGDSGTYNLDGVPGNDVTITVTTGACGEIFTWIVPDHIVMETVIAKGGNGYNVYDYTGTDALTDGNLHAPLVSSGKYADLSHIDFCFHYRLTTSKTADAFFTRDYDWNIDKECLGPASLTLSENQSYNYPFRWTADVSGYTDSDWGVSGTITIENNTPFDATITSISDVLSGNIAAVVDCGTSLPYLLAAGATLNCSYTAELTGAYDGTNTVTVTTSSPDVEGGTATADYAFGDPTSLLDECIAVTDDCTTGTTKVCVDGVPYTLEYACPIVYSACGEYIYTNTASFETCDSDETGSDNCTVSVNLPCGGGCTLTIGYWKTHSEFGPAPYDNTWAQLPNGASTPFFLSGKTYYQVAWTSPAGNAYYILAHQYIAAQLNQLNGASVPASVQTAFNTATTLLNTYTPAQIGALSGGNALRKQFVNLGGILDNYNNGITGPGHCSEESAKSGKSAESRDNAVSNAPDFMLYPNPSGGTVNVDLSGFNGKRVDLTVYNQLGVAVMTRTVVEAGSGALTLQLDEVDSGIYFVAIQSDGMRHLATLSILK